MEIIADGLLKRFSEGLPFAVLWHDFEALLHMLRQTRIRLKKLGAALSLLSVELVLIVGLFFISLFVFSFLVKEVFIDGQQGFDERMFAQTARFVTPAHTQIMEAITFLGTHTFLIPANILLTAYFLFVRRHRWHSIKVASIALSSTAMMFSLKHFFSRQRPLMPLLKPALGYSFPSGHSLMSFAFYGLLIYLAYRYLHRRWLKATIIILLSLLIFLIGFSRVYLRVHYASDVLAGFCVGIVWLVFSLAVLQRLERYSKRNIAEAVEEHAAT